jgi:ferric-dicitrate binding protein FerR (iron transport regulator)
LSWKKGGLIFRSVPLEKALRQVERYTPVEFEVLDDTLKSKVLTGRFRTGDVTALLDMLETNFGVHAEFDGADRILLRSAQ